ncbi:DUF4386 domain-containing protein [Bacillus tianshenii]|nr:DUF4386 domain-containing protein [Bacillus tianshenii]
MRTSTARNTQQKAAIISGAALLIMTVSAFFSYGYVHSSIVINGDGLTTLKNIQASGSLFKLEIIGWIVIIMMDLLVAWGFYIFLKPFQRKHALIVGLLRLLYTAMLGIAVSHLVIVNNTVAKASFGEPVDRAASQIMLSFASFESIWSMGLIIFGLHLIITGFVACKSNQVPKLISRLVVVAGFSYTLVHVMYQLIPQLDRLTGILETILIIPMFFGELGFGIWLLAKGRKLPSAD